jgi:hypothetical protein
MQFLRQLFATLILSILGLTVSAQTTGTCATNPTNITTCNYAINDDGYAIVPIPFGFPYYGKLFTHSIFFDNGLVSFYTPDQEPQRLGGQNYYAEPLSNNINSQFYYSIMPLWSDLYNYSGKYFTETDGVGFLRYNWENISQYGYPDRLNTFSAEIRPSGYIGVNYQLINIAGYPITSGLVGNASLGEWTQIYYKPPSDVATIGSIQNWSVNETVATDCSNPLNNTNCPGYTQSYFEQQCSINPLHSPSCPGYSQAYFEQQCSINSLYDPACPGYAVAYYDYQCGIDPLYHTGCSGYAQAYFDQQCSLNPLYNESCPGYDTAYFDQQCSLDPLYNQTCPGYDDAYYVQQCNANALYDSGCTGYDAAYFNQQCSINGLYDRTCPNYGEAYAKQNVLSVVASEPIDESVTVVQVDAKTESTEMIIEVAQLEISKTEVAAAVVVPITTQEKPKNDAAPSPTTSTSAPPARGTEASSSEKNKPKTNRQAIIERRQAAAKEKAAESGDKMTGEMQSADSMEKQVELQNVVLQVMGFTPGFDAYSSLVVPDGQMYKPFTIYDKQKNVDSRAGSRLFGGTDNTHRRMVDAQYQIGN